MSRFFRHPRGNQPFSIVTVQKESWMQYLHLNYFIAQQTFPCGFSMVLGSHLIGHKVGESRQIFLATLSVLLSPGVSGGSRSLLISWLFLLWLFAALVFVTYYGGAITSFVISTTPETGMTKLEQKKFI